MKLGLSAEEVLTTTRTVRKRLDLDRPVARRDIEECLEIALQAPNGRNQNPWRWIVVDDRELVKELARHYKEALDMMMGSNPPEPEIVPGFDLMMDSVAVLVETLPRVPAIVVPLMDGRPENESAIIQASMWGSIIPAVWSFFLALRTRGMASAWTTVTLAHEREIADLLGIPYDKYTQAGLFPVAYTIGSQFKKAWRKPLSEVLSYNHF